MRDHDDGAARTNGFKNVHARAPNGGPARTSYAADNSLIAFTSASKSSVVVNR